MSNSVLKKVKDAFGKNSVLYKIIGAGLVIGSSFGFLPSEVGKVVGQEMLGGGGAILSLLLGIFIGKDVEINAISKQFGMDKSAIKKYVRSKSLKDAVTKIGMVLIVACTAFMFIGCGAAHKGYQPPEVCMTEDGTVKDSIILDKVKYPRETAIALKLVGYETVKRGDKFTPGQYESLINTLLKIVDEPKTTYFELYTILENKIQTINKYVGGEVFIISSSLADVGSNMIPLLECDRVLLKKHLNEHLEIAQMMQE